MYIIYGKVVKDVPLPNGKGGTTIVSPQATFKALNQNGSRVHRLADAYKYETKADAEERLDRVYKYWENKGYAGHIVFDIRSVK